MDPQALRDVKDLARTLHCGPNGEPLELTDGHAEIYGTVFYRKHPRNQIITATRYGKSYTLSKAILNRSVTCREPWLILAPDEKKTQIIMGYVIDSLFDNNLWLDQVDLDGISTLERLKHERSRSRITFRNGGEISTLTANAGNRKRVIDSLTGQGATNIVEDEAGLIPDDLQAMVMRMLGDSHDNFLLKISNPFLRNHFLRSWQNDRYNKIFIDYLQGLREGRYTQDYIDEMKGEPFFDVLYECRFPDADQFLEGGYRRLLSDDELENAFIDEYTPTDTDQIYLGCDFAGGGNDRSAYICRTDEVMWLHSTNQLSNLMDQANIILQISDDYKIDPIRINTDAGGLGQGVGDYLHREHSFTCNNIMFGESAQDKTRFKNIRAEMYYRLAQWIRDGGKIVRHEAFYELLSIAYKTDTERKFQIQPKDELKKRMSIQGVTASSPDVADGAALTFAHVTMSGNRFFTF